MGYFPQRKTRFSSAKKHHLCRACDYVQPIPFKICPRCARKGTRAYFPSKVEYTRACQLIALERAGAISGLKFQPAYELIVNGITVGKYVADSEYVERGKKIIEDVKSKGSKIEKLSRLKIDVFNACYKHEGLEILIVYIK